MYIRIAPDSQIVKSLFAWSIIAGRRPFGFLSVYGDFLWSSARQRVRNGTYGFRGERGGYKLGRYTLVGVNKDHIVCETQLLEKDDDFPGIGATSVHVDGELFSMIGRHFVRSLWGVWR